ncbi:MAG TPA: hypothetical protein PLX35_07495 [Cyclobacteriaceae bacterium]|nr:hypothetical protein [Cyclobacteriaceae bacterium]
MKSELNHKEFKRRLTDLTSKKEHFWWFTPYNSSGTPFCGTYDDSTFDLTLNSFWGPMRQFEIIGRYREADNGSTEIEYTIGRSKFMRTFLTIAFTIIFTAFNTVLIVFWDKVEYSGFFTLNGFLGFGVLWSCGINWVTKRIVNQRFKDEFEIGVEDKFEKLANGIVKNQSSE